MKPLKFKCPRCRQKTARRLGKKPCYLARCSTCTYGFTLIEENRRLIDAWDVKQELEEMVDYLETQYCKK